MEVLHHLLSSCVTSVRIIVLDPTPTPWFDNDDDDDDDDADDAVLGNEVIT